MSAFFLNSTSLFGQDEPARLLEGSEDIKMDGEGNYFVRGNVRFVKDDTKMFCDSAYYNKNDETFRAYGNVHINKQDTLNLFCDSLFYDIEPDFAKLWGNVRVRDNEYKLETDSLDFYNQENKAVYRAGGVITNILTPEKLVSDIGYIYTENKNFFFKDNVVYTDELYRIETDSLQFNSASKKAYFFGPTYIYSDDGDMYCEKGWYHTGDEEGVFQKNAYIDREKEFISGDSLYYNRIDSLSIGKGNVIIRDTANHIEFNGDYAFSDEKQRYSYITGHALAKRFEDEEDTLFIHADTLHNYLDSINEPKLMLGYHGVKLFRSDMQGVCDSLSYDRVTGEMNLYIDPMLWAKNAQMNGDTITVYEKDGDISKAFLRLDALVVTEVDSSNYYNQVTGKTITAYFDSSEIRKVDIEGNAQTIYFMEDEDEEDTVIIVTRSGMNRIMASNFSLFFEGGDISAAVYRNSPDGKMHPMDQISEDDKKVESFMWDESRRPLSWQTMILTPEEFKAWKIHQRQKRKLLRLNSLVFEDSVSYERVKRSADWMNKYINTNTDYLFDLVYEDSIIAEIDSLNMEIEEFQESHLDSLKVLEAESLAQAVDSLEMAEPSFKDTSFKAKERTLINGMNLDQIDTLKITPIEMNEVNRWGNALNKFIANINNYQVCMLAEINLKSDFVDKHFDSLLLIDNSKYIFDSVYQKTIKFNLDSISEQGKEFTSVILDYFPNFKEQQERIKQFDKRIDSIERAIQELLPEKEENLNLFNVEDSLNVLNFINSPIIDSLIGLNPEIKLKEKAEIVEEDSIQLAENKIIVDSLRNLMLTLKRPKLNEKQKTAIKISKYFDFNKEVYQISDSIGKKTVKWEEANINNQNVFAVYKMLEAIKVDALNIYREILLQEVLRIREERKAIEKFTVYKKVNDNS